MVYYKGILQEAFVLPVSAAEMITSWGVDGMDDHEGGTLLRADYKGDHGASVLTSTHHAHLMTQLWDADTPYKNDWGFFHRLWLTELVTCSVQHREIWLWIYRVCDYKT